MRISTRHAGVKRDLDRLIRHPKYGIKVKLASVEKDVTTYWVDVPNLLDLAHEVPQLSENTAKIQLG